MLFITIFPTSRTFHFYAEKTTLDRKLDNEKFDFFPFSVHQTNSNAEDKSFLQKFRKTSQVCGAAEKFRKMGLKTFIFDPMR